MSYAPGWNGTTTGTTTLTPSIWNSTSVGMPSFTWTLDAKPIPTMDMEEFLAIKDKDLQVYIRDNAGYHVIHQKNISVKVDNNIKVGYYLFNHQLKQNQSGTFYVRKQLHQYIVYDKVNKKLKKSRLVSQVGPALLADYFKNTYIVNTFKMSDSAEFYKQIILGKIKTVEDILKFNRSYVIRDKTLSLDNLYCCIVFGDRYCTAARVFHNFNELTPEQIKDSVTHTNIMKIEAILNLGQKIHSTQINDYDSIREKFVKEQSDKFNTYKERRQLETGKVHQ